MLNKKDFLKYASKLAFPIMIQNLIGTLVNIADTVMLGYVSQTAMSASSLANQYTFILFCLYYGMATGTSVLCAQYWGKGDKKTVERILGLAERISLIVSLIFFVISFLMIIRPENFHNAATPHRQSENRARTADIDDLKLLQNATDRNQSENDEFDDRQHFDHAV